MIVCAPFTTDVLSQRTLRGGVLRSPNILAVDLELHALDPDVVARRRRHGDVPAIVLPAAGDDRVTFGGFESDWGADVTPVAVM